MKFNSLILILAVAILPSLVFAQEEQPAEKADPLKGLSYKKKLKYADAAYAYGNYFQALDVYKKLLEERAANNTLLFKLAYCYMDARDYKNALSYFSQALAAGKTDAETHYFIGLMENKNANYANAISAYGETVKKNTAPWSDLAKERIKSCEYALELIRDSLDFQITHLNPPINGPYTEYAPKVVDNYLYYSSLNTDSILNQEFYQENKKTFSRIYKSSQIRNEWVQGAPLSTPFNGSDFHSGNYSISADGKRVYFTKCTDEGNANITCKIYQSTKSGSAWTAAVELSSAVNDKSNNTHPAVASSAGAFDILYFASNRDGGHGGFDIYSAEVAENGKASNVKNLGSNINTSGNEQTPFYSESKGLLYFSSDMHLGLGGYDNFSSKYVDDKWETPTNLGYPINSSADDQYYTTGENSRSYYFVSNRPGIIGLKSETCCDDIFKAFDNFVPVFAVKGQLFEQIDADNTAPIENVVVAVYEVNNGARSLVALDSSGEKSNYIQPLKANKKYEVEFKKPGYFSITEAISTLGLEESDTFSTDIHFEKIRKDKSYSLSNIYYDYNSAELNENSKNTLDKLYTILSENKGLVFELSSHTDSIGSASYNQKLSQRRAQSCVDYLLSKGITADQLKAKGYGESKPVAPNSNADGSDNPAGRAKNRRTEYRVIGEMEFKGDEIIFQGE